MRTDLDYIKKLLDIFNTSTTALITIAEIKNAGIAIHNEDTNIEEKFYFHFMILVEEKLVTNKNLSNTNMQDMGVSSSDLGISINEHHEIRLSKYGRDLSSSLEDKGVLNKLKSELPNAPFKIIIEMGQKLLEHYIKKKIDALIKND
ncbi:hypothetical protein [Moritella viscosa]|uniref:DUF2513 domain-containing protein n=1 Tax=Moritella viscosa TaxID=80854 RepID=A0A1L0AQN9_9GAMM|nr:hypothetical protein [Moritella viscosa]SGZ19227.1 Putative uncharacterized protein [Moritella viscosa]